VRFTISEVGIQDAEGKKSIESNSSESGW